MSSNDDGIVYYKSQCSKAIIIVIVVFTIICGGAAALLVIFYDPAFAAIPGAIYLLAFLIANCFPIYSTIAVDNAKQCLIVKSLKIIFCCSKNYRINIDEILWIDISLNPNVSLEINDEKYYGFNVEVKLKNGDSYIVISGQIDKDNESGKVKDFLKENLPSSITIETTNLNI